MARWRIALHALDRTGPPRLARSFVEWIAAHRPDVELDVVAFRGGVLEPELATHCPVTVLLADAEAWDHHHPDAGRVAGIRAATATLRPVDTLLLVSVSAGQVLDLVPDTGATVVAWVVEQGDDLHWLDGPVGVRDRVDVWIAGSEGTRDELVARLDESTAVEVSYEFVDEPQRAVPSAAAGAPHTPRRDDDALLVVGAGIGTHRKAPDLFLEIALALGRRRPDARFVWIGGESDPLIPLLRAEIDRLGLDRLELVDNTPHLGAWLAAADVFVHPARLDAFPLVCLEAALAGTPVVAFDGVGGVPEMFGPTFRGAPYPDIAGLVDAVDALAGDGSLADLGRRQRDHVRGRYVAAVAAPALAGRLDAVSVASVRGSS